MITLSVIYTYVQIQQVLFVLQWTWLRGRTLVFDRGTFPVLHSICS